MLENALELFGGISLYVYLVVFAIGVAWIGVGLILGGLESMLDLAHDAFGGDDAGDTWGHQQVGLSPFSPLMLAVFGMLFGVVGMALDVFSGLGPGAVLLATAAVAVVLDGGVYWGLYAFFVRSQSNSLAVPGEAVGSLATVATRIMPGATGTINFELSGRRQQAGARALPDETIQPGEVVRIISIQGSIAQVRKEQ